MKMSRSNSSSEPVRLKNIRLGTQVLRCIYMLFTSHWFVLHHQAQGKGKLENKWILVNIQNTSEFVCQVLNRDIWKDASIRTLIQKHFIFWQVRFESKGSDSWVAGITSASKSIPSAVILHSCVYCSGCGV